MRILLAIDGSPYSDAAVAEICRRPWPPKSEVRVITVDSPMNVELLRGGSPGVFDDFNRRLRDEAHRRLNDAAATIRRDAPSLLVTPILREGSAKDMILKEAENWPADLIVLGSHGYGAVRRLFLGSVSLAVTANAPCSVEIVRARSAPSKSEEA